MSMLATLKICGEIISLQTGFVSAKAGILDITCAKSQSIPAKLILAIQLKVAQKTTPVFLSVCILRVTTKILKIKTHQAQLSPTKNTL